MTAANGEWIMPLANIDDIRDELADTEARIARLENQRRTVDPCRQVAAVLRAEVWRLRLRRQLHEMIEAGRG